MTSTISSSPPDAPRAHRRGGSTCSVDGTQPSRERSVTRRIRPHTQGLRALDRYVDPDGRLREVVARPGVAGSLLVFDRDVERSSDCRLVAHLGADEPPENAEIVCGSYVEFVRRGGRRCRQVTLDDFTTPPMNDALDINVCDEPPGDEPVARVGNGRSYRLMRVDSGMSIPELRWCRLDGERCQEPVTVSVREAIGALESYEPVRTLTGRALVWHGDDADVSIAVLKVELARLLESPIVLNRGLREAVVRATERGELSMSEIAIRCGRVKYDRAGNPSGETSWLARRLGILPEGGRDAPTPWIHSDVLALITRQGLGICPREAELG